MTRTYALKRLLEHGSMTRWEIVHCTRWTMDQVSTALSQCVRMGVVEPCSSVVEAGHRVYLFRAVAQGLTP